MTHVAVETSLSTKERLGLITRDGPPVVGRIFIAKRNWRKSGLWPGIPPGVPDPPVGKDIESPEYLEWMDLREKTVEADCELRPYVVHCIEMKHSAYREMQACEREGRKYYIYPGDYMNAEYHYFATLDEVESFLRERGYSFDNLKSLAEIGGLGVY